MEFWTTVKQPTGTWLFSWDAESTDSFEIWLNGELLTTVDGGEYEFIYSGYEDAPPPLEIIFEESGSQSENEAYPPYAILQWRESSGASAYLVERYIDDEWIAVKTIMNADAGYYWYKTAVLEDEEDVYYRVSALDSRGNTGTPITFEFNLVRNPSPPVVIYSIDSSGDLVVTEA